MEFEVSARIVPNLAGEAASKVMTKELENGLEGQYVVQQAIITDKESPLHGESVPVSRTLLNKEMAEALANGEEITPKKPLPINSECTLYGRVGADGILRFDVQGQQTESQAELSARLLEKLGQKTLKKA